MTATGARSPAGAKPPEALVARFKAELERLWPEGGRLGLAVSGGPDSLAMLLLAQAAIPEQFEVATVDHGLRPESAGECAMVAEVCAARSIPCEVLRVEVEGGNLQAQARAARYSALRGWAGRRGMSAVATAHHTDDQAETLLMRLNRGSGVAGLAGVRERSETFDGAAPVVRPLLWFRREELAQVLEGAGLAPVHDPSNVDDRFDRARLRKAIAGSDWLDPLALSASASNLADADEAIDWAAHREWAEHVTDLTDSLRYRRRAPRAVAMRIAEWAILVLGGSPRGKDVARLVDGLDFGTTGNLGGVLVTIEGEEWVFRPEPPRRSR